MNDVEKLIELFKNCDTVTFTVTGCGEESYQTIEFKDAIETLEKQSSDWIPVGERLPNESGKYLIIIKNLTGFEIPEEYIFICNFHQEAKEFIFDTWEDNKVIAWMPLPKTFKED